MFLRTNITARVVQSAFIASRGPVRFNSYYSKIIKLNQLEEFQNSIKKNSKKLAVVYFYTTWCGPCKAMAPHLSKFVKEYPEVSCYKVDVDENPEIAKQCEVTAMPTFVFAKDGEILGKVVGADPNGLEKAIIEYK